MGNFRQPTTNHSIALSEIKPPRDGIYTNPSAALISQPPLTEAITELSTEGSLRTFHVPDLRWELSSVYLDDLACGVTFYGNAFGLRGIGTVRIIYTGIYHIFFLY